MCFTKAFPCIYRCNHWRAVWGAVAWKTAAPSEKELPHHSADARTGRLPLVLSHPTEEGRTRIPGQAIGWVLVFTALIEFSLNIIGYGRGHTDQIVSYSMRFFRKMWLKYTVAPLLRERLYNIKWLVQNCVELFILLGDRLMQISILPVSGQCEWTIMAIKFGSLKSDQDHHLKLPSNSRDGPSWRPVQSKM